MRLCGGLVAGDRRESKPIPPLMGRVARAKPETGGEVAFKR
jgi:hypothetical protein